MAIYDTGVGYSCVNTARCALSAIITPINKMTFGAHPLVMRLMKGIYNERVPVPRYQEIWDTRTVLDHLVELHPLCDLSLKDLTLKTVMLIALVSAQRGQTLEYLSLDNLTTGKQSYTFVISKLVKQSKPGRVQPIVKLPAYTADKRLCVVHTLREYLDRTEPIRGEEKQLFVSYMKPHKGVSCDTIRRWLVTVLARAGVDVNIYKAHSTRSAATSAAKRNSATIDMIMNAAGWKSDNTFAKFYDKPVQQEGEFANRVLLK